jgi:hypothetical protein
MIQARQGNMRRIRFHFLGFLPRSTLETQRTANERYRMRAKAGIPGERGLPESAAKEGATEGRLPLKG